MSGSRKDQKSEALSPTGTAVSPSGAPMQLDSGTPMSGASSNASNGGGAATPASGPSSHRTLLRSGSPAYMTSPSFHSFSGIAGVPRLHLEHRGSIDAIQTAAGSATPKPGVGHTVSAVAATLAAAAATATPSQTPRTPTIGTPKTPATGTPKPVINSWQNSYDAVIAPVLKEFKLSQAEKHKIITDIQATNSSLGLMPVSMMTAEVNANDFVREPNTYRSNYKMHKIKSYPLALFIFQSKADGKYYIVNHACTNELLTKAGIKDFPINIAQQFPHDKAVLANGDFCWSAIGSPFMSGSEAASQPRLMCDHELLLQIKLNGQNLHSAVTLFAPGISGAGEMTFTNGVLTNANSESGSYTLFDDQNFPALKRFFPHLDQKIFPGTRPRTSNTQAATPNSSAAGTPTPNGSGAASASVFQSGQTFGYASTANPNAGATQAPSNPATPPAQTPTPGSGLKG